MLIDITYFDTVSRRLQRQSSQVSSIIQPMPATVLDPDLDWVRGHWDADKYAVDSDGHPVLITDPPQPWLGRAPNKLMF